MKTILSFKKLLLSGLVLLGVNQITKAQTTLAAGDIVIIGLIGDGSGSGAVDEFTWVPLSDLETGTIIYFTDTGYFNNSALSDSFDDTGVEGLIKYTASSAISAGTLFTVTTGNTNSGDYQQITSNISDDTDLAFAGKGDTIIVFQTAVDPTNTNLIAGAGSNITPIFQISSNSDDFGSGSSTPEKQTDLIPGLTDGTNAVAKGSASGTNNELSNIRYTGTTAGTGAAILAAVANDSNWEGTNDTNITAGYSTNGASLFNVNPPLEIKDTDKIDFQLYPNPSSDFLNISVPVKNVQVFSITGNKVLETDQNAFSVKALTPGVYFINIETENGNGTKKLMKL